MMVPTRIKTSLRPPMSPKKWNKPYVDLEVMCKSKSLKIVKPAILKWAGKLSL